MIVETLRTLLGMFWTLLKIPLFILAAMLALFGFLCAVQFVYLYRFKGLRLKKGNHYQIKKEGFFRRLFVDAPSRIVKDIFDRDPEFFRHQGLHVFCGEQGSGFWHYAE